MWYDVRNKQENKMWMEIWYVMVYELFHTTTAENCSKIVANGFRSIKSPRMPLIHGRNATNRKKPGTLGYGLYAFDDEFLAKDFKNKVNGEPRIIKFAINPLPTQELDLTPGSVGSDIKNYNAYKRKISETPIYEIVSTVYNNHGEQSSLEGALLEMYVVDILKRKLELDVKCIKAPTSTGVYHSKGSVLANGLEYLVKCNSIIV